MQVAPESYSIFLLFFMGVASLPITRDRPLMQGKRGSIIKPKSAEGEEHDSLERQKVWKAAEGESR